MIIVARWQKRSIRVNMNRPEPKVVRAKVRWLRSRRRAHVHRTSARIGAGHRHRVLVPKRHNQKNAVCMVAGPVRSVRARRGHTDTHESSLDVSAQRYAAAWASKRPRRADGSSPRQRQCQVIGTSKKGTKRHRSSACRPGSPQACWAHKRSVSIDACPWQRASESCCHQGSDIRGCHLRAPSLSPSRCS